MPSENHVDVNRISEKELTKFLLHEMVDYRDKDGDYTISDKLLNELSENIGLTKKGQILSAANWRKNLHRLIDEVSDDRREKIFSQITSILEAKRQESRGKLEDKNHGHERYKNNYLQPVIFTALMLAVFGDQIREQLSDGTAQFTNTLAGVSKRLTFSSLSAASFVADTAVQAVLFSSIRGKKPGVGDVAIAAVSNAIKGAQGKKVISEKEKQEQAEVQRLSEIINTTLKVANDIASEIEKGNSKDERKKLKIKLYEKFNYIISLLVAFENNPNMLKQVFTKKYLYGGTLLHNAITLEDPGMIKVLLNIAKKGGFLHEIWYDYDDGGYGVFHLAAFFNHTSEAIQVYFDVIGDFKDAYKKTLMQRSRDDLNVTALHIAAEFDFVQHASMILQKAMEVGILDQISMAVDGRSHTPFSLAVSFDKINFAKKFIEKLESRESSERYPGLLKEVILRKIREKKGGEFTMFHSVINAGRREIAYLILKSAMKGDFIEDILKTYDINDRSPLYYAVFKGETDIVDKIVTYLTKNKIRFTTKFLTNSQDVKDLFSSIADHNLEIACRLFALMPPEEVDNLGIKDPILKKLHPSRHKTLLNLQRSIGELANKLAKVGGFREMTHGDEKIIFSDAVGNSTVYGIVLNQKEKTAYVGRIDNPSSKEFRMVRTGIYFTPDQITIKNVKGEEEVGTVEEYEVDGLAAHLKFKGNVSRGRRHGKGKEYINGFPLNGIWEEGVQVELAGIKDSTARSVYSATGEVATAVAAIAFGSLAYFYTHNEIADSVKKNFEAYFADLKKKFEDNKQNIEELARLVSDLEEFRVRLITKVQNNFPCDVPDEISRIKKLLNKTKENLQQHQLRGILSSRIIGEVDSFLGRKNRFFGTKTNQKLIDELLSEVRNSLMSVSRVREDQPKVVPVSQADTNATLAAKVVVKKAEEQRREIESIIIAIESLKKSMIEEIECKILQPLKSIKCNYGYSRKSEGTMLLKEKDAKEWNDLYRALKSTIEERVGSEYENKTVDQLAVEVLRINYVANSFGYSIKTLSNKYFAECGIVAYIDDLMEVKAFDASGITGSARTRNSGLDPALIPEHKTASNDDGVERVPAESPAKVRKQDLEEMISTLRSAFEYGGEGRWVVSLISIFAEIGAKFDVERLSRYYDELYLNTEDQDQSRYLREHAEFLQKAAESLIGSLQLLLKSDDVNLATLRRNLVSSVESPMSFDEGKRIHGSAAVAVADLPKAIDTNPQVRGLTELEKRNINSLRQNLQSVSKTNDSAEALQRLSLIFKIFYSSDTDSKQHYANSNPAVKHLKSANFIEGLTNFALDPTSDSAAVILEFLRNVSDKIIRSEIDQITNVRGDLGKKTRTTATQRTGRNFDNTFEMVTALLASNQGLHLDKNSKNLLAFILGQVALDYTHNVRPEAHSDVFSENRELWNAVKNYRNVFVHNPEGVKDDRLCEAVGEIIGILKSRDRGLGPAAQATATTGNQLKQSASQEQDDRTGRAH